MSALSEYYKKKKEQTAAQSQGTPGAGSVVSSTPARAPQTTVKSAGSSALRDYYLSQRSSAKQPQNDVSAPASTKQQAAKTTGKVDDVLQAVGKVKDTVAGLGSAAKSAAAQAGGKTVGQLLEGAAAKATERTPATTQKAGTRDDSAVRRNFAQRNPEMTGGELGEINRGLNSGKVYIAAGEKELEALKAAYDAEPTQERADAYNARLAKLQQDTADYEGYVERYKAYYTPEARKSRIEALTRQVKDAADEMDRLGAPSASAQSRLASLQEQLRREEGVDRYLAYEALRENPDFEEESKKRIATAADETQAAAERAKNDAEAIAPDTVIYNIGESKGGLQKDLDAKTDMPTTSGNDLKDVPDEVVDLYYYIRNTRSAKEAQEYLELTGWAPYYAMDPMTAAAAGATKGVGLQSLASVAARISKGEDAAKYIQGTQDQMNRKAQADHPGVFGAGNVGGTLALAVPLAMGGGAVAGAAGLGGVGSAVASGAAGFGGSAAVQEAGDLAAGQISPGKYVGDVLTGAVAGGAGGAVSMGLGVAGSTVLQRLNLAGNPLARAVVGAIRGGGSAATRVGITEGSEYLRDPDSYEFNAEDVVSQVLVSAAFDGIMGAITKPAGTSMATTNQVASTSMEEEALLRQVFGDDYRQMTPEEIKKAWRALARANHPDLVGQAGDETMRRINQAYDIYKDRFLGKAQSSWEMAQSAKASGDAAAYRQAAADFADRVSDLQTVMDAGTAPTSETSEAIEILRAVSASMTENAQAAAAGVSAVQEIMGTPAAETGMLAAVSKLDTLPTAQDATLPTAQKNAATEAAGKTLAKRIQAAVPQLRQDAPVATVKGDELPQSGKIVDRLFNFINALGNKVNRPGFGDVLFSRGRIKGSMIGHGISDAKIDTFAAVPAVIEKGRQIDFQKNWKGRTYDTYTFAAPIEYKGQSTYLGVIVTKDAQDGRYYLHAVVDENGEIIFGDKEEAGATPDGRATLAGAFDTVVTPADRIVPQAARNVNPLTASQSDALPTAQNDTLPTAQSQMGLSGADEGDTWDQENWDSLIRTRETPLEPMSDEWLDDLVMNGETGYVPKDIQTAEEIAVSQGLAEDTTPKKPRPITAEEMEAGKVTQSIEATAAKVLKDYWSKADSQEIVQGLQDIFDQMGLKDGLSDEQLGEEAKALAQKILSRAEVKNSEAYELSQPVRAMVRDTTIHVPADVQSDFPDFSEFRKHNFGRMKLSGSEGRAIDDLFAELGGLEPGIFDQTAISHPADQLAKISEYLDGMQTRTENPFEAVMDDASATLGQELIQSLKLLDGRRRALRAAASVREARDAFFASAGPDPNGPEPVASVLNELPTAQDAPKDKAKNFGRTLYRALVDTGEAVDRFGKAVGDKSLYAFYNYARASSSAGQNMLARGGYQADIWGRKVGPSLGDIFSPIREKGDAYYNDFQMYLLHIHNVDRMSRYNPAAVDIAQADFDTFRADHPEISGLDLLEIQGWADQGDYLAQTYLQLRQELSRVQNTQNKPVFGEDVTAEDSKAEADRLLREHPEFGELAQQVYQYSRNLLQYQVDSQLMTPEDMEQILDIYPHYVPTYRVTDGDSKQIKRAGLNISKVLGRATGGNADVVPIHVAMARQTMRVVRNGSANRFASRLLDGYFQDSKGKPKTGSFIFKVQKTANLIHPDTFDMLEDPTPKMENTFTAYQDGEALTVSAEKGILEAVELLTGKKSGTMDLDIWRPFQAMNSLFKELVTGYNPMFSARNFARDLQEAGLYSKDLGAWAKAYPKAVKEITTNGELWQRYQALGGVWSSVFDYNKGYVEQGEGHSKLRRATLDKVDALNLGVEQAPRLAEFIAQLEKNGDSPEAVMDAMLAAANVTTNFGRSGKVGAFLNKTFVPFLNPGIQGVDKMSRTFFGKKSTKEWLRLAAVCAILGFAPMVINEVMNQDAPNWEDIRDSEKDTYWLIHIGDGKYLRIPKGRDISVVGMAADRIVDAVRGEKVDVGGSLATAANQIAPANPLENNILAAWVDADLFDPESPGKTWYGGKIESDRLQGYAPGQRYDEKTDAISKAVGGALNISPKKINYILDQYSGVVGDFVLPMMTPAGDKNPISPFVKAFVLDAATSNRISSDFYDAIDQLGYDENAGHPEKAVASKFMSKQSKAVSDLNKQIREIENSDLPNKEKVEKVRDLKIAVSGIQKNALEQLPAYEEAVKKYYTGFDDEQLDVAYREANREVFGAEYALQMEGKKVYEKAQKAHELGASYDSYYAAYVQLKGKDSKWEKQQALQVADIPDADRDAIYSVVAGDSSYSKFQEAGLTDDEAQQATWAVDTLSPMPGKETVSSAQKWRAILDCGFDQDKTLKGLQQFMSDTQAAKVDTAYSLGVPLSAYVTFQEKMAAAPDQKQATVKGILDGIVMTNAQRAVLWQMANTGWPAKSNPYDKAVGAKVQQTYQGNKQIYQVKGQIDKDKKKK